MCFAHLHLHTHFAARRRQQDRELMPRVARPACRRAPSPTTATCSARCSSTRRPSRSRREADHRLRDVRRAAQPLREGRAARRLRAGGNYHLILLAMNHEGYRNLCRMVIAGLPRGLLLQAAHRQGAAARAQRGLIRSRGCLARRGRATPAPGRHDARARATEEYSTLFDDRFYLEIQDNHLPEQAKVNDELRQLAPELGIPLVGTNDCHYLERRRPGPRGAALHPDRQALLRREALEASRPTSST